MEMNCGEGYDTASTFIVPLCSHCALLLLEGFLISSSLSILLYYVTPNIIEIKGPSAQLTIAGHSHIYQKLLYQKLIILLSFPNPSPFIPSVPFESPPLSCFLPLPIPPLLSIFLLSSFPSFLPPHPYSSSLPPTHPYVFFFGLWGYESSTFILCLCFFFQRDTVIIFTAFWLAFWSLLWY